MSDEAKAVFYRSFNEMDANSIIKNISRSGLSSEQISDLVETYATDRNDLDAASISELISFHSQPATTATPIQRLSNLFQGLADSIGLPTKALGVLSVAAVAAGAALAAWKIRDNYIKEEVASAKAAATELDEKNAILDAQKAEVATLKKSLDSGTLSDAEAYQARARLLEIQNQIVDSYGLQAEGIDLVNGGLEEMLLLMEKISKGQGERFLTNESVGIDTAKSEMEKERRLFSHTYRESNDSGQMEAVKKLAAKYKDRGLSISDNSDAHQGSYGALSDVNASKGVRLNLKANAADSKDVLEDLRQDLLQIQTDYGSSDALTSMLNDLDRGLGKAQTTLDEYQALYNTSMQEALSTDKTSMVTSYGGKKKYGQIAADYTEAVEQYNQALANPQDTEALEAAKNHFEQVQEAADAVSAAAPQYAHIFGQFKDELNQDAIKDMDLRAGLLNPDNSTLAQAVAKVKEAGMDELSFSAALNDARFNDGKPLSKSLRNAHSEAGKLAVSLVDAAKGAELIGDSEEDLQRLAAILRELGVLSGEIQAPEGFSQNLKATPNLDSYHKAQATENGGSRYDEYKTILDRTTALYRQGMTGTDDFRTGAAIFSPTGAADEKNFAENLPKAQRYFTDGRTGVDNFMQDLQAKGMADYNSEEDRWSFPIDDLQKAAESMGMSFEWFMSMFGKMSDYGYSNNFVGSTEEGASHLTDLYGQLSREEAHMEELKSPGQYQTTEGQTFGNQTAIDAQQKKIDELRASIQETIGYMNQLTQKSAEDMGSETAAAADTIEQLTAQKQEVLNDTENPYAASVAAQIQDEINRLSETYHLEVDAEGNLVSVQPPEETPEVPVEGKIQGTSSGGTPEVPVAAGAAPGTETAAPQNTEYTLTANDQATPVINDVNTDLDALNGKTVTANILINKSGDASVGGTGGANGEDGPGDSEGGTGGVAKAYGGIIGSSDGMTLTGELGEELVVRGNRFFTVGRHGAEMAHLRKGDIVFNHRQTRELLSRGRIGSRGRALASGNATQAFDWIERRLQYFADSVKRIADRITDYVAQAFKRSQIGLQMKANEKQIAANEKGYQAYKKKANEVAAKESIPAQYRTLVHRGTWSVQDMDTSTDSGKALAEAISLYQSYYEKAKSCKDAVAELRKEQMSLYSQKVSIPLEAAEEKIRRKETRHQKLSLKSVKLDGHTPDEQKKNLNAQTRLAKNEWKIYRDASKDAGKESKQAAKAFQKARKAFSKKEKKRLVKKGPDGYTEINLDQIQDTKLRKKAERYNQSLTKKRLAKNASLEANSKKYESRRNFLETQRSNAKQKFDNRIMEYEYQDSLLNAGKSKNEAARSLHLASGKSKTDAEYKNLLEAARKMDQDAAQNKRAEATAARKSLAKNGNKMSMADRQEATLKISSLEAEADELTASAEKYRDELNEIALLPTTQALEQQQAKEHSLQNEMALAKAQGNAPLSDHYQKLIENSKLMAATLLAQNVLLANQQTQVEKGSEAYQKLQSQIDSNSQSIADAQKNQAEWNHALQDMPVEMLERAAQSLSSSKNTYQNLLTLRRTQGRDVTDEEIREQLSDNQDLLDNNQKSLTAAESKFRDSVGLKEAIYRQMKSLYENSNDAASREAFEKLQAANQDIHFEDAYSAETDMKNLEGERYSLLNENEQILDQIFEPFTSRIDEEKKSLQKIKSLYDRRLRLEKARYTLEEASQRKSLIYNGSEFVYQRDEQEYQDALQNLQDVEFDELLNDMDDRLDELVELVKQFNLYNADGAAISDPEQILKDAIHAAEDASKSKLADITPLPSPEIYQKFPQLLNTQLVKSLPLAASVNVPSYVPFRTDAAPSDTRTANCTIGDIHIHGAENASGLARAIVNHLPREMQTALMRR